MQDGGVEILVAGSIAATARVALPDAARAVDEHLGEAASAGPILRFIAEVPLAEDARGVAGGLEHLRERRGLQREPLALEDRVSDAVLELVAAGEERAARGRARGADVEVREAHALGVETVHVRGLEHGVAVGGDVAVALVVGEEEDDVRALAGERGGGGGGGTGEQCDEREAKEREQTKKLNEAQLKK